MPHRELVIDGQRIPGVTELLDTMDKKWLRPWFAKEELVRCIDELAPLLSEYKAMTLEPGKNLTGEFRHLLAQWRKRVKEKDYAAEHKAKDAAAVGTLFHGCVEAYLKTGTYVCTDVVQPLMDEFVRFDQEWGFDRPGLQEVYVLSKRYVYQGCFDYLGGNRRMSGLGLWDWKTSNKIDDTFGLQIALYAYAYGEQQGWTPEQTWAKITHGGTVRLDKRTRQLEYKVYDNLPYLFRVASALREPYDYRNQVGAWEEETVE